MELENGVNGKRETLFVKEYYVSSSENSRWKIYRSNDVIS